MLCIVEVEEGKYRRAPAPPSFELAYLHLFMSSFRQFPYLSDCSRPKVDDGKDVILPSKDAACVLLFYQRAKLVGFSNARIEEGLGRPADSFEPPQGDIAKGELPVNRRWGTPHSRTFRAIQQEMFLPRLAERATTGKLSVRFLASDFLDAFLDCGTEKQAALSALLVAPPVPRSVHTARENARLHSAAQNQAQERIPGKTAHEPAGLVSSPPKATGATKGNGDPWSAPLSAPPTPLCHQSPPPGDRLPSPAKHGFPPIRKDRLRAQRSPKYSTNRGSLGRPSVHFGRTPALHTHRWRYQVARQANPAYTTQHPHRRGQHRASIPAFLFQPYQVPLAQR